MSDQLDALFADLRAATRTGARKFTQARRARVRAATAARLAALRPPPETIELDGDLEAERALPRRRQDAPIIGWRFARMVQEHDGWRFASLNDPFGSFTIEDEAVCKMRGHHKAPNPGCTCGFYALKRKPPLGERARRREWLLEVELYGTVVVHELGFRAQYQRVRSVLAGFCWCEEPASVVVVVRPEEQFPSVDLFCAAHVPKAVPLRGFARMLGTDLYQTALVAPR